MYIVLPLLDTLTSAPIHTLHTHFGYTHIHTHIWICTAGMMSVTMVYLYICVCMCVCVWVWGVYYLTQTDSGDTLTCVAFTKMLLFSMTKTTSLFLEFLFWMTSLPFEWISISPENSAVMYVNLYYGWWCHQGETQPHAVAGLRLLAVMFTQYLFYLFFC